MEQAGAGGYGLRWRAKVHPRVGLETQFIHSAAFEQVTGKKTSSDSLNSHSSTL